MRIEGSERQTRHLRRGLAIDARPTTGAGSIGGGDSMPALASVVASGRSEGSHVHGGAAARPSSFVWSTPPETVPLAGAGEAVPLHFPDLADTLLSAASGPVIQLLDGGESIAALAGLHVRTAATLGDMERRWAQAATGAATALQLEARELSWTDPASVDGAAVLALGAATLVLSSWPEMFAQAAE